MPLPPTQLPIALSTITNLLAVDVGVAPLVQVTVIHLVNPLCHESTVGVTVRVLAPTLSATALLLATK